MVCVHPHLCEFDFGCQLNVSHAFTVCRTCFVFVSFIAYGVSRPFACFYYSVLDFFGFSVFNPVLGKFYEVCCPGCAFIACCFIRHFIFSTIKFTGNISRFTVSIKCKRYLRILRSSLCSVCIKPCLFHFKSGLFLLVGNGECKCVSVPAVVCSLTSKPAEESPEQIGKCALCN